MFLRLLAGEVSRERDLEEHKDDTSELEVSEL